MGWSWKPCPHKSGDRYYRVVQTGAIVRCENAQAGANGEITGRTSSVMYANGTVGHCGWFAGTREEALEAEARAVQSGEWEPIETCWQAA
jgi:hypothetical protein